MLDHSVNEQHHEQRYGEQLDVSFSEIWILFVRRGAGQGRQLQYPLWEKTARCRVIGRVFSDRPRPVDRLETLRLL
jgi:hypothetical protein